jgi:hypothetical protein
MIMDNTVNPAKPRPHGDGAERCAPVPEFRRLNYVYGQLLGAADFRSEQSYFRDKQRLHNRCLHGYGVVCGLLVHPVHDPRDCAPGDSNEEQELKKELADLELKRKQAEGHPTDAANLDEQIAKVTAELKQLSERRCAEALPARIVIDCGMALDCEGNELVVRRPLPVDLWRELSAEDRKQASSDGQTLYLSLCYCEQPIDPIRPVLADQCGSIADCTFGKLREAVRVKVSVKPPEEDRRCETCCSECGECCILLARIDGFRRGYPIDPAAIHNEVRRRLSTYQSTVITGINWVHGGSYLAADAEKILGTEDENASLEIHFSRPILTSSLQRGVVELRRIEGGPNRSGDISEITGDFLPVSGPETTVLRYRQTGRERMNEGDRILIQVRCAFLLDRCCRPVDGANVGGRVPPLPGTIQPQSAPQPAGCEIPPWGYGPWKSGSGSPGSDFESWIVIAEPPGKTKSGAKK